MNAFGHKCNPMSHQHRFNLGQNEIELPKKQLRVIENNITGLSSTLYGNQYDKFGRQLPITTVNDQIISIAHFRLPQSTTEFFQSAPKIRADWKLLGTTEKTFNCMIKMGINPTIEKKIGRYLNFFKHCLTNSVTNISDWKKFDRHFQLP